jgi:16S rRNA (adenine1518-N6/adenine1519-N6)-dimethyltransferase
VNPHTSTTTSRPGNILRSVGVRPSKARGQSFLVQQRIAEQIANAAEIRAGDSVVEIGAGLGILSEMLVKAGPLRLTLVEVDGRLAELLTVRFADDPRIRVVNRDFLRLTRSDLGAGPLKVVGNLPFSVAAAILRSLCDHRASIELMVLMFQREVGERIRARPGSGNYGALSVFTSLYWDVIEHFRVAAGSFHPRPRVDAEVLVMKPQPALNFDACEEGSINRTIRAAFSAPRKTIRNSLAGGLAIETNVVTAALERAGIDPVARPATLGGDRLIALARILRPADNE